MKKTKIIIRQHSHWLAFEVIVIITSLLIVFFEVIDGLYQWGITEDTDFGLYNGVTIVLALPVFIMVMHRVLNNKGSVEITENYAYAKYPSKISRGYVDFSKEVYYSFYKSRMGNNYIIVSNNRFSFTSNKVEDEIDYENQIPIIYTKRVQSYMPKEDWRYIALRQ